MGVDLNTKKEFVTWLHDNTNFGRRDVYWLLNYLLNHKAILQQVVFVESVEATPRGLKITALWDKSEKQEPPLQLFLENRVFTDPEQVFHEIRMNWKQELYIEVHFPNAWKNSAYLAVLEDNPFKKWNEQVDEKSYIRLEEAFKAEEKGQLREQLLLAIDSALEKGDQAEFERLSEDLKKMSLTESLTGLK